MNKKPITNRITSILVGLLVLIAGVLPLIGGTRTLGLAQAGNSGGFPSEKVALPDGPLPQGSGSFQPGTEDDRNTPPNWQGIPGGQPSEYSSGARDLSARIPADNRIAMLIQYMAGGGVLLFGVLASIGLLLYQGWGKVMTVITAVIVLATTIPSFSRIMNSVTLVEALIKVLLSVAAVILVFFSLKKSSKSRNTKSVT